MTGPVRSQVWTAPFLLGVAVSTSLIVALLGDGIWDAVACAALACALGYAAAASFRRAGRKAR